MGERVMDQVMDELDVIHNTTGRNGRTHRPSPASTLCQTCVSYTARPSPWGSTAGPSSTWLPRPWSPCRTRSPTQLRHLLRKVSRQHSPRWALHCPIQQPVPPSFVHSPDQVHVPARSLHEVDPQCRLVEIGLGCGMPYGTGVSYHLWKGYVTRPFVMHHTWSTLPS